LLPETIPHSDSATEVACDVLVVGVRQSDDGFTLTDVASDVDAALDGLLSETLTDASFKAKVGDVALVPTGGRIAARTVAAAGLGDGTDTDLRRTAGETARRLGQRATIASALSAGDSIAASVEGYLLGSYTFTKYKSDPKPSKLQRILLLGASDDAVIEKARARAEATMLARDLVNEPPATLTPEEFARRAQDVADTSALECTIFDPTELANRGFGGILGVARGSAQEPRFIQLRYAPKAPTGKVALVGKGITFDSGGLSIKDARSMETMKTDMSGAAAVVGAMSALSRLDVGLEVLGFVSATENMPGGNAIKPGDVIRHYGGHTSEVLNTDAEGRLVLADALAFACEQKPDAVVDVATLTGGMMVAVGARAAGIFSTNDDLRDELIVAGNAAGERLWPMPLYDDYRKDIDSEIADVKNTGGRFGSPIYAALFLRDFVDKTIPWAHLDIAGPARADSDRHEVSRGGSGFATRTLIEWLDARGG